MHPPQRYSVTVIRHHSSVIHRFSTSAPGSGDRVRSPTAQLPKKCSAERNCREFIGFVGFCSAYFQGFRGCFQGFWGGFPRIGSAGIGSGFQRWRPDSLIGRFNTALMHCDSFSVVCRNTAVCTVYCVYVIGGISHVFMMP